MLSGRAFVVEANREHTVEFFTHGSLDSDNHCAVETFTTNGVEYESSYEVAKMEYRVRTLTGRIDADRNEVVFQDGLRVRYSDGYARDSIVGTMVWEQLGDECELGLSKIYSGPARLFSVRTTPETILHSLIMIENDRQTGGFTLREKKTVCRRAAFATQTPGISILLIQEHESGMKDVPFRPSALSDYIASTSQRDFLYLSSQLSLFEKLAAMMRLICENSRAVLYGYLNSAANGNPYSFRSLFGPGHQILRGSAAAFVIKCSEVQVEVTSFDNCTFELPVMRVGSNRTEFLDPFSFVLSESATIHPCSEVMESSFRIGSRWICRTSGSPRACAAPEQLDITKDGALRLGEDLGSRLNNGLYSASQLSAHRLYMATYRARSPLVNKLTAAAALGLEIDGNLGLPFDTLDRHRLAALIDEWVFPSVSFLGIHTNYLFMAMCVFGILKMFVMLCFRITFLVRHRGCGTHVCGAITDFTLAVATLPFTTIMAATEAADRRLDQRLRDLNDPEPTNPGGTDQSQADPSEAGHGPKPDAPPPPGLEQVTASQVTAAIGNALRNFGREPERLDRI